MNNSQKDSFNHIMGLAQCSHQKGDLPMAINLYKEALKIIPKQAVTLEYIGIAYCSQQNFKDGIIYLEKANVISPENALLLTNLGTAYLKLEAHASALPLLQKAVQLKPDFDDAWHKLANTLKAINRIEEAIHAYEKTIALNVNNFNAWYNFGNTMLFLGNYKTAIEYYQKCLNINPSFVPAHNNIGVVLLEWDRSEEAEQHYLKALQLQPNYKDTIKNLVHLYNKIGNENQATRWSKELLNIEPDNELLRFEIETKAPVIPLSNDNIDDYINVITSLITKANKQKFTSVEKLVEHACYPSPELMYQGKNNKIIKQQYDNLFEHVPKSTINHVNNKPNVGFVVTRGHEGVFLKCMRGILNNIDTDKINVSIICSLPNGEKIIAPEITNPTIKFLNLPSKFTTAQQKLVDAKLDILYYWEIGTDAINYFLALIKPAKIQVTSWGWPGTSGLKTIDYFISQKNLEPDNGQELYTEKLIQFEKLPVYYYRPPVPASPKHLQTYGLPTNKHIYICQQNLRKVHPDFDTVIAQLLEKDPEGIVLFINDKSAFITKKLQHRLAQSIGNHFSRVIFMERMSEEDYLGLLSQCTVVLDTLHYGGGANTIYDAFQAGTPIVTLEGNQHSARFASAVLKQVNMGDTIAHNLNEYIDKAVALANDESARTKVIERMKQHSEMLFEDSEAVKELEQFFINIFNKV